MMCRSYVQKDSILVRHPGTVCLGKNSSCASEHLRIHTGSDYYGLRKFLKVSAYTNSYIRLLNFLNFDFAPVHLDAQMQPSCGPVFSRYSNYCATKVKLFLWYDWDILLSYIVHRRLWGDAISSQFVVFVRSQKGSAVKVNSSPWDMFWRDYGDHGAMTCHPLKWFQQPLSYSDTLNNF